MKRLMCGLVLVLFSGGLVGCGGELSEDDAAKGWAATNRVLTQGNSMASSSSGGGPEGETDGFSFTFDYTCPEDGTAQFAGQISLENLYGEFDWQVTYNNCGVDGVLIDGDLGFSLDTVSTETSYGLTYVYKGELVYSGEVDGTCVVDMTGNSAINTTDTSVSYDVSYQGTVCGHDANEALAGSVSAY